MVVSRLKDVMKDLSFKTVKGFCHQVSQAYKNMKPNDEFDIKDVSIIAKYDEAAVIIGELVRCGYDIHSMHLKDPECDGYDDEYIISLCSVDEKDIWCEPMVRENGYIDDESGCIFVMDNCSSNVLSHLNSDYIYEVHVDEFDDYEDNDECCCYYDDILGFDECFGSKSEETELSSDDKHEVKNLRETYRVNGKEVSKDEYDKVVRRIEDNYSDILSSYAEFMADLHDWHKMLGL